MPSAPAPGHCPAAPPVPRPVARPVPRHHEQHGRAGRIGRGLVHRVGKLHSHPPFERREHIPCHLHSRRDFHVRPRVQTLDEDGEALALASRGRPADCLGTRLDRDLGNFATALHALVGEIVFCEPPRLQLLGRGQIDDGLQGKVEYKDRSWVQVSKRDSIARSAPAQFFDRGLRFARGVHRTEGARVEAAGVATAHRSGTVQIRVSR